MVAVSEAGQLQDLAAAETGPNLSPTGTVKLTLLIHCFSSIEVSTAEPDQIEIIQSMRTAQAARLDGHKPEQFEVSEGALNHSENQRTALSTAGVVSEMCKGC